jgi:thioredoxin 1
MVVINDLDIFNKAISEHDLCLVKIGTPWCGPCKMVQKNIEDIEKFHTDVYFIEVDADSADEIVDEFGVRSVPVVLLIENGEVTYRSTGLLTQPQLENLLN